MAMEVTHIREPGKPEADFCAALYGDSQYRGPDEAVNPFDPRYRAGGVHFSRDRYWFMSQFAVNGARLLLCTEDGQRIGYSLHFTNPKYFPPFASDVLRYRDVPGVDGKLAYTYLFILQHARRGRKLSYNLLDAIRGDCERCGCRALAHEFFIRPVINMASAALHAALVERCGAADTGVTVTHELEVPGGKIPISYAHCLIPTGDCHKVTVSPRGALALVPRSAP